VTAQRTPRALVSIERATLDDDYYAEIHRKLRGQARRAFERAVDDAWRARSTPSATSNRRT
jgi:predicted proteasome-type protease